MAAFLNKIRSVEKEIPLNRQIAATVGIALFGVLLGVISKYLDTTASNELPFLIEYLDVRNFLGRLSIWILLAVCISVYSASPVRAGINVFLFFAGMVASYYLYSKFIAGFFPRSYAMIWIGITVLSPFLAFLCWYSKGEGKASLILSAGILAVLFNLTFLYGWNYFAIRSLLELLVFICGFIVLLRRNFMETALMLGIGVTAALVLHMIIPFEFG